MGRYDPMFDKYERRNLNMVSNVKKYPSLNWDEGKGKAPTAVEMKRRVIYEAAGDDIEEEEDIDETAADAIEEEEEEGVVDEAAADAIEEEEGVVDEAAADAIEEEEGVVDEAAADAIEEEDRAGDESNGGPKWVAPLVLVVGLASLYAVWLDFSDYMLYGDL